MVFRLWPAASAALMSAQAQRTWPALVAGFSVRRSRIGERSIRESIAFRGLGVAEGARATIDNEIPHPGNRYPAACNVRQQRATVHNDSQQRTTRGSGPPGNTAA